MNEPASPHAGKPLLTVQEVARTLRMTPATVRDYIRRGRLPACKLGRHYLIASSDLETLLSR